jgi:hypothetical protein
MKRNLSDLCYNKYAYMYENLVSCIDGIRTVIGTNHLPP